MYELTPLPSDIPKDLPEIPEKPIEPLTFAPVSLEFSSEDLGVTEDESGALLDQVHQ